MGNWYQVTGQVFCGGTIIDAYTIVSAASCVKQQSSLTYSGYPLQYVSLFYPTLESMFNIYAGVSSVTNSPNAVKLAVKKVVVVSKIHIILLIKKIKTIILKHAQYSSTTYLNDIALFLLSSPIQFNQYIQPACLPNPSYGSVYPTTVQTAYLQGWVRIQ